MIPKDLNLSPELALAYIIQENIILQVLNLLLDLDLTEVIWEKLSNFQDRVSPLCNCGLDIESTEHFLLPFCLPIKDVVS